MPKSKKEKVDLSNLNRTFLECRVDRHNWSFVNDATVANTRGRIVQVEHITECSRCGAKKHQWIEVPSFTLIASHIYYPEGYLHRGGRVHPSEARREFFGRTLGL